MAKNRWHDVIRFNNGNMNIRFTKETLDDIKANKFSGLECLSFALEDVDTYIVGEPFSLGNYSMGYLLYNSNQDKCYTLDLGDIDEILLKGKTLKLYARKPDENDREALEENAEEYAAYEYEQYTPSATAGDYSPNNPWDAPGMSIHDFI